MAARRTEWIDHVKGITITMVVAHHVLEGLNNSFDLPTVMYWYQILSPVRMPLFFLVAGLFAQKAIHGPLRAFVDGKIVHFLYFYILWSAIIFAFRYGLNAIANNQTELGEILRIFWDPLPVIWFLYALLLAFAVARALRSIAPAYTIAFAALLQAASLSGNLFGPLLILDKLGYVLVYFLTGMHASEWIRARAEETKAWHALAAGAGFIALGILARRFDMVQEPLIYFTLSALSAIAIVSLSVLAVRNSFGRLFTFIGMSSLVIYLTHFLPAAGTRIAMVGIGLDSPALILPVALAASVIFGIVFQRVVEGTPLQFLVKRPAGVSLPQRLAVAKAD